MCLKLDGLCHFLLVSIVCWEICCLLNDFFDTNYVIFPLLLFFKQYFFIFTSQMFDYISWSKFIEVYPVWDLLSFFSTFVYFSKNLEVLSCPFLPHFSQFQHLFLIPGLRWQSFSSAAVVPWVPVCYSLSSLGLWCILLLCISTTTFLFFYVVLSSPLKAFECCNFFGSSCFSFLF